ncbi:MAG: fructosamine kinase family protein [Actinomycetota bacterium]
MTLADAVLRLTGRKVAGTQPLSGGCVGEVRLVKLADGGRVVAKLGPGLEPEAWMLRRLAGCSRLPVPDVIHGDDDLILMTYVEAGGSLDGPAQEHAAELLADLHGVTWHSFGLERDTLIGGLAQPNPQTPRWLDFWRDHRLLYMAGQCLAAGRLPGEVMDRVERLAARLGDWIDEPRHPGLVHGDAWAGNVLCRAGRVAAFIDPAIYFADPEVELAFGTIFGTFDQRFYARYDEIRGIRPGFWEARCPLYTLWPLLVHVRLFGGSYLAGVERVIDRFLG